MLKHLTMKYIGVILCILTTIMVVGCTSSETHKEIRLERSGQSLRIPIPSTSNSTSRNIRYFEDNGEGYLAVENGQTTSTISIYKISDCSHIKDVVPQIQGPNGLNGRMMGFDIVNLDTIFVSVNGFGNRYYIIDSDAHLKKTIPIVFNEKPFIALPPAFWSSLGKNVYMHNNKIFTGNEYRDEYDYFKSIHEYSIGYCYDMKRDSFYNERIHYPDIRNMYPSVNSIVINDNKYILSFAESHQVFVHQDTTWTVHDIRSRYIERDFDNHKVAPADLIASQTEYIKHPQYRVLLYDKYRDVYYRMVYPGIDVTPEDDVLMLGEFKRIFSIMVIDKDFKVIGETLMPEKIYNINMFFINEAGLWISTNNVENAGFEEDAINFDLFELK